MARTEKIYSANNPFQYLETLRDNRNKRFKEGLFLVEGVKPINVMLARGWSVQGFIYDTDRPLSAWAKEKLALPFLKTNYALTHEMMQRLTQKSEGSEIIALCRMKKWEEKDILSLYSPLGQAKERTFFFEKEAEGKRKKQKDWKEEDGGLLFKDRKLPFAGLKGDTFFKQSPLLLAFDRPSSPGNLGSILRSCSSLGADALLLCGHGADPFDPQSVRASIGAIFSVPLFSYPSFESLRDAWESLPLVKIGTSALAEKTLWETDLTRPLLFYLGNETDGLSRAFRENCDEMVRIPMDGVASSLNVSVAATVFLYEAQRQRQQKT